MENFSNWDGQHYLGIAKGGYDQKYQYAFFPLYPLLIRFLEFFLRDYFLAAMLLNLVCVFLGLYIFYDLIERKFNKKDAKNALINMLVFPASFFFLSVYSEGLFFLLIVLTFYFLEKKKFLGASLAASLSTLVRLSGLALILTLFIYLIRNKKIAFRKILILILPLGLLFYFGYLFAQTGDPLYFLVAEEHWQRSLAFPGWALPQTISDVINFTFSEEKIMELLTIPFTVFGLGLVIRAFRFLPEEYRNYSLFSILIPLLTPTLMSMPRFLLPIFPIFVVLALIKNPGIIFIYRLLSVCLLFLFCVLFVNGYWVS